ncbi:MAG TPA: hypothetical protein VFG68_14465, partial [Fimbriiglobus sp.]|nr:hypothetical protein [Fimbriiglobus sp.]
MRIRYAWDENKAFLRGAYTLTKDGKPVSSGTQVIGQNPLGGLRAWVFDGSGTFGEAVWTRDGSRWLAESSATLPDGTDATAVNVLIPLGPAAGGVVDRGEEGHRLRDRAEQPDAEREHGPGPLRQGP